MHPITAVQTEYSLWTRDLEDEILPTLRELGIGLVAYSPLGRGFLSGRFKSPEELDEGDFRRNGPRFTGENLEANLGARREGRGAGGGEGRHAGAAGARVGARPGRRHRPDPRHQAAQLPGAENAAAADVELTEDDLARIASELPEAAGDRYDRAGMAAVSIYGTGAGRAAVRFRGVARPITFLSDYGYDRRVRRRLPGGDRPHRARGAGDRPGARHRPPRRPPGRDGARGRASATRPPASTWPWWTRASAPPAGRGGCRRGGGAALRRPGQRPALAGARPLRGRRPGRRDLRLARVRLEPVSADLPRPRPVRARWRPGWRSATPLAEPRRAIDPGSLERVERGRPAVADGQGLAAEVGHVDAFGNVSLVATAADADDAGLEPGSRLSVAGPRRSDEATYALTFADAEPGAIVLLVDSATVPSPWPSTGATPRARSSSSAAIAWCWPRCERVRTAAPAPPEHRIDQRPRPGARGGRGAERNGRHRRRAERRPRPAGPRPGRRRADQALLYSAILRPLELEHVLLPLAVPVAVCEAIESVAPGRGADQVAERRLDRRGEGRRRPDRGPAARTGP